MKTEHEWEEFDPDEASYRQSTFMCLQCGIFPGWLARDELPAGPCEAKPRTITVRAAAAVDPVTGEWSVDGFHEYTDEMAAEEASLALLSTCALDPQITYITVEIPIRETPEVTATVEETNG